LSFPSLASSIGRNLLQLSGGLLQFPMAFRKLGVNGLIGGRIIVGLAIVVGVIGDVGFFVQKDCSEIGFQIKLAHRAFS
jgi:hypothetical protein